MKGSKKKSTFYTIASSVANITLQTVCNLIYINLLVKNYGSSVNGLISSITQFVTLFSILEGGFSSAIIVALYKPLMEKNYNRVNDILYTGKKFLLKATALITTGVLIGGSIYLGVIDSPISMMQTSIIMLICLLTTVSSLYNVSLNAIVLQGSNMEYITQGYTMVAKIVSVILQILLVVMKVDIVYVFSCTLLNNIILVIMLKSKIKKDLKFITYRGQENIKYIKGTKDVFTQKIANTVFESTDLILVSTCINLAAASVYSIYNQVFRSIYNLFLGISRGPNHSFGQLFAEREIQKSKELSREYSAIIYLIAGCLFTITGCLTRPFLQIYTQEFADYDYINLSLVIVFFSFFYIRSINSAYAMVLNVTGNFKLQNKQMLVAAVLNIVLSYAFIRYLGLISIVLGSFISTTLIVEANMYQSFKFLNRKGLLKEHIILWSNYLYNLLIVRISFHFTFDQSSYFSWFILAIPIVIICIILVVLFNTIFFRREIKSLIIRFLSRQN